MKYNKKYTHNNYHDNKKLFFNIKEYISSKKNEVSFKGQNNSTLLKGALSDLRLFLAKKRLDHEQSYRREGYFSHMIQIFLFFQHLLTLL